MFSSCDFNINNRPGPQMSWSTDESKSNGTFICNYKIKGNMIHNIPITEVFAEHQFWRENDQFLLKKTIDCCQSQLVITSDSLFEYDGTGYGNSWKLVGFNLKHSGIIYKDYKGLLLPDSIPLTIVSIKGRDSSQIIEKRMLYKIHN